MAAIANQPAPIPIPHILLSASIRMTRWPQQFTEISADDVELSSHAWYRYGERTVDEGQGNGESTLAIWTGEITKFEIKSGRSGVVAA